MNKKSFIFLLIIISISLQTLNVNANSAVDILCKKIDDDYYFNLSDDIKNTIKNIKEDVLDEEDAILKIVECLDEHSMYFTKEYCNSAKSKQTKSAISFQTTDSAYIKIYSLNSSSEKEFIKVINSSVIKKDLYIDLSDCSGGFISSMIKILEWIIPKSIVCTARFKESNLVYETENDYHNPERRVYVIVSNNTASAGEILAGIIKLRGCGSVIGTESTYGKTTIQEILSMKTGGVLKITVGEYLIGTDWNISNSGISPDYLVSPISD